MDKKLITEIRHSLRKGNPWVSDIILYVGTVTDWSYDSPEPSDLSINCRVSVYRIEDFGVYKIEVSTPSRDKLIEVRAVSSFRNVIDALRDWGIGE